MPTSLPLNLNSMKFLGGGSNERKYLLFSDLLEIDVEKGRNEIDIDVTVEGTSIRVYYEDPSLRLASTFTGDDGLERA